MPPVPPEPSGAPARVAVTRAGHGPEVVLVHGGARPGATWRGLEPLSERWTLVTVHRRGFAASPPPTGDRTDFDDDTADLLDLLERLDAPAHVIAHSYGGVGAMLAAATAPERIRSLTLVEAGVFVPGESASTRLRELTAAAARGTESDPAVRKFLRLAGAAVPEHGALPAPAAAALGRLRHTRSPYEADLPLDRLRESSLPILVASGAHHDDLERVMDALAERLAARRLVTPGAGHFVMAAAGFTDGFEGFLASVP